MPRPLCAWTQLAFDHARYYPIEERPEECATGNLAAAWSPVVLLKITLICQELISTMMIGPGLRREQLLLQKRA